LESGLGAQETAPRRCGGALMLSRNIAPQRRLDAFLPVVGWHGMVDR